MEPAPFLDVTTRLDSPARSAVAPPAEDDAASAAPPCAPGRGDDDSRRLQPAATEAEGPPGPESERWPLMALE